MLNFPPRPFPAAGPAEVLHLPFPRDTSPGGKEGALASPGEGCVPSGAPGDPSLKSKDCFRGQQKSGAESAAQKELAP